MGILINKNSKVMVQGITGKEGERGAKYMLDYGTKVVCGVTPSKGGLVVEGLPVFDSVKEAKDFDSGIDVSVLYVPPLMVYDAAMEAMQNKIKTLLIFTENVPIKDVSLLLEFASNNECRVIGCSSIGVLNVGETKLGSIGGGYDDMFCKGNVGIISKSGGMCAETSLILTQQGIGQSTVIGIGGDVIIGTTFVDVLELFEKDKNTKLVVLYGEVGGFYEEQVAQMIKDGGFTKPVIAFISGSFVETLPRNLAVGHAGAILEHGIGSVKGKKKLLKKVGVHVVDYYHEIPEKVKEILNGI